MTAQTVNAALVLLSWQVGLRIRTKILKEKPAEYGEAILPTPSAKLVADFGNGFSARNLARLTGNAPLQISSSTATPAPRSGLY